MGVWCRLVLAGALVLPFLAGAGAYGQSGQGSRTIVARGGHTTQPVSSVALATVMFTRDVGDDRTIDLLVVWRGEPGWFMTTSSRETGGGRVGASWVRLQYGEVSVDLELERPARRARINGVVAELGDANVILVDRIDTEGPGVVETLRIDPEFSGTSPVVYPLLRRSEKILSFIRCDVRLPDPKRQAVFDHICAQIVGGQ